MRIVSWNVNSLKPRHDRFFRFLDQWQPDVVCLQETKSLVEDLPKEAIESAGWHLAAVGQKTYNGVALVSKTPIEVVSKDSTTLKTRKQGLFSERPGASGSPALTSPTAKKSAATSMNTSCSGSPPCETTWIDSKIPNPISRFLGTGTARCLVIPTPRTSTSGETACCATTRSVRPSSTFATLV